MGNRFGKRSTFPAAHKFLAGTSYVVDCFTHDAIPGVTAYFLSHFHADHYAGLGRKFRGTPIFCSPITAQLCQLQLRLPAAMLHPLPLGCPILVSEIIQKEREYACVSLKDEHIRLSDNDAENPVDINILDADTSERSLSTYPEISQPRVSVTLFDANHCPGAVMFLFTIEDASSKISRHILHTGDFRACPERIIGAPALTPFLGKGDELSGSAIQKQASKPKVLDVVYLDTTYMESRMVFPSQEHVLTLLTDEVHRIVVQGNRGKLIPLSYLIVVGTYTIGKERVCERLAKLLATRLWTASDRKRAIMELLFPAEMLSDDPLTARVHVVNMMDLSSDEVLGAMLDRFRPHYTHIIAVRATGWTAGQPFRSKVAPKAKMVTGIKFATKAELTIEPHQASGDHLMIEKTIEAGSAKVCIKQEGIDPNDLQDAQKQTQYVEKPTLSTGQTQPSIRSSSRKGTLPRHRGRITFLEVPYSEHSSSEELQNFLAAFQIGTVIPTVEGSWSYSK
ncbi:hypothetical protein DI09_8p240 [Mitosporidium daphniae]|uniref:DNA repair metallo-beta-lactamase domain-containing protein n=1 Tax=Mitosporidium daphniae TaxID=1485682 RepID=A0A098VM93_9MICR|nr:uncharacterized protein DI09_8p240 [Mitosporidium daphniae]KGG50085.1 hypothetical protein DI09_8p240 [Mitosporidium daphniae]|eukprot:XP_013236512.1 uncharacterized protein DI09_8p240 [Mitosporidium daphniae]